MAALLQVKAAETKRLRVELETILCTLSKNMSLLMDSIFNSKLDDHKSLTDKNDDHEGSIKGDAKELAESLLLLYMEKCSPVSSPLLSLRLHNAIKEYTAAVLSKGVRDAAKEKCTSIARHSPEITHCIPVDWRTYFINKRRLEHVHSFVTCKNMQFRIENLIRQRDELQNSNSSSAYSQAILEGLISMRNFWKNRLEILKAREKSLHCLKQEMREAEHVSDEFKKRFKMKKLQLLSAKSYLNNLSSDMSSVKSLTLQRSDCALRSISHLSMLLKRLWICSGDKSVNLGASAALNISHCAHIPHLSSQETAFLFAEICKRLSSTSVVTNIDKVLDRIHQIVVDADSADLLKKQLNLSLQCIKELQGVSRSSLENNRVEEKEACLMMATALKKISFRCSQVAEKQEHLRKIWNYWSDCCP